MCPLITGPTSVQPGMARYPVTMHCHGEALQESRSDFDEVIERLCAGRGRLTHPDPLFTLKIEELARGRYTEQVTGSRSVGYR